MLDRRGAAVCRFLRSNLWNHPCQVHAICKRPTYSRSHTPQRRWRFTERAAKIFLKSGGVASWSCRIGHARQTRKATHPRHRGPSDSQARVTKVRRQRRGYRTAQGAADHLRSIGKCKPHAMPPFFFCSGLFSLTSRALNVFSTLFNFFENCH